ncbi:hypothetical protein ACNSO8_00295, partial [Yersinia sp. LJYL362]|uniref:hypothetical protein n=1 Tax=Yersinia sp. LJYL362 TaxID=3402108 RepID=UPI003AB17543
NCLFVSDMLKNSSVILAQVVNVMSPVTVETFSGRKPNSSDEQFLWFACIIKNENEFHNNR